MLAVAFGSALTPSAMRPRVPTTWRVICREAKDRPLLPGDREPGGCRVACAQGIHMEEITTKKTKKRPTIVVSPGDSA